MNKQVDIDININIDEIDRKRLFLLNKLNDIYKPEFRNIIKYDFNPSCDFKIPFFKFSCPISAIPSYDEYQCQQCMDHI